MTTWTRQQWQVLEPRRLDLLVHTKVRKCWGFTPEQEVVALQHRNLVPEYSTHPEDVWLLLGYMESEGYDWEASTLNTGYSFVFMDLQGIEPCITDGVGHMISNLEEEWRWPAQEKTFCQAACIAALLTTLRGREESTND